MNYSYTVKTWNEYLSHIRNVFKRLLELKLYGKLKISEFGEDQVEFLGFKLRNNSLLVDPINVKAVQVCETPACKRHFQLFLDMINFHRRFI